MPVMLEAQVPAVSAGADADQIVGVVRERGRVTRVSWVPEAAITGANTHSRSLILINTGQDGSEAAIIGSIDFNAGVNAMAFDAKELPLNFTMTMRDVEAGDVIVFASEHVGTGIADPGGHVQVEIGAPVVPAEPDFVAPGVEAQEHGYIGKRPITTPDQAYTSKTGPSSP